jgi:hypothetical protein
MVSATVAGAACIVHNQTKRQGGHCGQGQQEIGDDSTWDWFLQSENGADVKRLK